jgi:hypothetical protein
MMDAFRFPRFDAEDFMGVKSGGDALAMHLAMHWRALAML